MCEDKKAKYLILQACYIVDAPKGTTSREQEDETIDLKTFDTSGCIKAIEQFMYTKGQ